MKVGRYLGWVTRKGLYRDLARTTGREYGVVTQLFNLYTSVDLCVNALGVAEMELADRWVAGALPPREPGFLGVRRMLDAPEDHMAFWHRVYEACSEDHERQRNEALGDAG